MSNNIYDILKKMQSLETPKANLTEGKKAKPDFLDMDKDGDTKEPMKKAAKDKSKGAVAEAVARVEQHLAEKYMGFKKKLGEAQVNELSPATLTSYADKAKGQRNWAGGRAMAAAQGNQRADPEGKFDRLADKRAAGYNKAVSKGARDLDKSGQKSSWDYDTNPTPAALSRDKGMAEGEANEDMLSPGQKKIAKMSPPPDKIDANDLAALRAGKDKKKEGAGVMHFKKEQAKADGKDSFKLGDKEYAVKETMFYDPELQKSIQDKSDAKALQQGRDKMAADELRRDNGRYVDSSNTIYDRVGNPSSDGGTTRYQDAKTRNYPVYQTPGVAGGSPDRPVKEGFPTVADAEKRMREKEGKTAHGKKTTTAAGTKHERDYDAVDKGADVDMTPKGRGRPKKDRFA